MRPLTIEEEEWEDDDFEEEEWGDDEEEDF